MAITILLYSVFLFCGVFYAQLPQKVVVCGVCKNVEERLACTRKIMETIGSLFTDYRIIVYENNSTDKTPAFLDNWSKENSKMFFVSEQVSDSELAKVIVNRLKNGAYFGPETIARARNKVLSTVLSPTYDQFEYLIWMDMDFKYEPDYAGIAEVFTTQKSWDAVFAYGIDPAGDYWDWYAFRDERCPLGSETLGNAWWYLPKKLKLTKQDAWYPVYSAFGGCGIYRKAAVRKAHYSGLVTADLGSLTAKIVREKKGNAIVQYYNKLCAQTDTYVRIKRPMPDLSNVTDPKVGIIAGSPPHDSIWRMSSFVYKYPSVCEHVTLHASMIMQGYDKLFINPRFVFRY